MSVACAGDNVIDVYLPSGQRYPGGNAVNVAVAARRSGVRSAYLGAVGADDAGRRIQDALTAEDVSVSRLRVLPGSTAWCEVQLLDGDREFVGGDLGVSELKLTAEDFAYLADFAVVHTGDNSRLETQLSGLAAVTRVSFDFGDHTSDADYVRALVGQVWCACFSAGHLPAEGATALADEMASMVDPDIMPNLFPGMRIKRPDMIGDGDVEYTANQKWRAFDDRLGGAALGAD